VSRPVSHVNMVCVPEKNPFSGTGAATISDAEEGMETAADGPQVSPIAGNGAGGHALAAIEPLEGGGAVLAELARAVEHDLATPGPRPGHRARLRPRLGRFCRVLRPPWPRATAGPSRIEAAEQLLTRSSCRTTRLDKSEAAIYDLSQIT